MNYQGDAELVDVNSRRAFVRCGRSRFNTPVATVAIQPGPPYGTALLGR